MMRKHLSSVSLRSLTSDLSPCRTDQVVAFSPEDFRCCSVPLAQSENSRSQDSWPCHSLPCALPWPNARNLASMLLPLYPQRYLKSVRSNLTCIHYLLCFHPDFFHGTHH